MREEESGVVMRLGKKPQVDEKVPVDAGESQFPVAVFSWNLRGRFEFLVRAREFGQLAHKFGDAAPALVVFPSLVECHAERRRFEGFALLVCKSLDLFPQPADDIETIGVVGHKLPGCS